MFFNFFSMPNYIICRIYAKLFDSKIFSMNYFHFFCPCNHFWPLYRKKGPQRWGLGKKLFQYTYSQTVPSFMLVAEKVIFLIKMELSDPTMIMSGPYNEGQRYIQIKCVLISFHCRIPLSIAFIQNFLTQKYSI